MDILILDKVEVGCGVDGVKMGTSLLVPTPR